MIKLPLHLKQMGESNTCGHRSGWPFVIAPLKEIQTGDGFLLDDFVERTFQQTRNPVPWTEPWVGIFHHPPHVPHWFDPTAVPEHIFATSAFQRSKPNLRGCIALSKYLADWLRPRMGVQTIALYHPTDLDVQQWTVDAFEQNPDKRLIQVGWYQRNYRSIYQVESPLRKVHLFQNKPWVRQAAANTDRHSPTRLRKDIGETETIQRVENDAYDKLLCENVVFLELFDTSANNAIVECIARNTPVVVNYHPAVAEYLGEKYPLFYENIAEVPSLLTINSIIDAHTYLARLNKAYYNRKYFRDEVLKFVERVM